MIKLSFTLLEFILLFWFLLFALVLLVIKLNDNDELDTVTILIIFMLLPLVITFWFVTALYEITIGQIVKLVNDKKRYKDAYKEVQETVYGLQKKLEDLNKPNVEVGPNE